MSLRQIIREKALQAALTSDGKEKTSKALRRHLRSANLGPSKEVTEIVEAWREDGTLQDILKLAVRERDARITNWLWEQDAVQEAVKVKKKGSLLESMKPEDVFKKLKDKYKEEFGSMAKSLLKDNIRRLRKTGKPSPPPDEREYFIMELKTSGKPTSSKPADPQKPNKSTAMMAAERPAQPVPSKIYHEFFGPDGRRILEEIRVPIVTGLFEGAQVVDIEKQPQSAKPSSQEVTPVLFQEMSVQEKKEYFEQKFGGVKEKEPWEELEEEEELGEELEGLLDENDPTNLDPFIENERIPAPSNPKVEELKRYVASLEAIAPSTNSVPLLNYEGVPDLEVQQALLSGGKDPELEAMSQRDIDISNSVIVSSQALEENHHLFPQYALFCASQNEEALPLFSFQRMGRALTSFSEPVMRADPRLFINTNHPWSFFVCGLQGSGKSHSTSCLLESCLIPTPILGRLQKPLSGLVFHFSKYASASAFQPCEAAFLAVPHPDFAAHQPHRVPTTVLVSPSNYHNLRTAYAGIPGVKVKKLQLHPKSLNISAMLSLMSVNTSEKVPLYINQLQLVLREMATKSRTFDYLEFLEEISRLKLSKAQLGPLDQRLRLLESFLDLDATDEDWKGPDALFSNEEGALTIIDLSCPFVDEELACVLFNICLGMFLETPSVGKVVAVDEAHKYITGAPASKELTESLLSLIRQQRHFGVRVIVSTQEPTIDPRLIELSNVTLMHRFTSPEWFARLRRHIGIGKGDHSPAEHEAFNKILSLRTGEAYAFAPSAMAVGKDGCEKLGGRLLKVKTRKRVTWDGGRSILSVD